MAVATTSHAKSNVIQFVPMRSRKVLEGAAMGTWLQANMERMRKRISYRSGEMNTFVAWVQDQATTTELRRWLAEYASVEYIEWLAAQEC